MSATAVRTLDNYIGGRWTAVRDAAALLDVTNPASCELLSRVRCTRALIGPLVETTKSLRVGDGLRSPRTSAGGMVGVNIGVAAPVAFFPFSGWKDSFLGDLHAHGIDAVEFYTRKKTVTSRWLSSGQGSGSYFVERG